MNARRVVDRFRARYREIAALPLPGKPLRAYANWALANYELATRASKIRARPLMLTVDPTNSCQLRCPLCPTGLHIQDRRRGRTSVPLFRDLMDAVGDYVFFVDLFNWGEPLLDPNLEELIQIATAKGIVTTVSSNLSLPLSDERIHKLVRSGLGRLSVSLDGTSHETNATYRREGSFELVVENMRRILETRTALGLSHPIVEWEFLVFRFNEHEKQRARELADEIGVDRLTFLPPDLATDRMRLSDADRAMVATWEARSPGVQRGERPDADLASPGEPVAGRSRCGWHYMSAAINWDGSVAPCCTLFETKDDFGSLPAAGGGGHYMDVVNNDRYVAVRDRFAGRRDEPVGLVCEHCPTPKIMPYHRYINRRIVLHSVVRMLESIRHPGRRRAMRDRYAAPALTHLAEPGSQPG